MFVSFKYTAKWISYTYTYIHSFLGFCPTQAITEYWIEFPVLCSRSLLVIYFIYSIVFVFIYRLCLSVPIFQFISPPLLLSNKLLSISSTLYDIFHMWDVLFIYFLFFSSYFYWLEANYFTILWDIFKGYRWTYPPNSNRVTDVLKSLYTWSCYF